MRSKRKTRSLRLRPTSVWICLLTLGCLLLNHSTALAQAGLRESLERLDTDEDGRIDPEEITPLARPYLEQIAESRRISLERSNSIETFQEAARVYHALKNGVSGRTVRPETTSTIRPFGPDEDQPMVPEFGLSEVKYPYTQADLEEADRTLRRYDRNRDGYIDREEAAESKWTHRDPFEMDLNNDGRLSRLELGQRYARRRLLEEDSDELIQRSRRVGNGLSSSSRDDERREDNSQWWRRGGSDTWLAASVLGRFDKNRNGSLDLNEAQDVGLSFGRVDIDRDGELSRTELQAYLKELQDEAGNELEGIPGWFFELDADMDRQVSMVEFTDDWTEAKFQEFSALDLNDDGLLTSNEVIRSKAAVGGSFTNSEAKVLAPRQTVISEIEIDEDLVIDDVNVQVSITHSHVAYLDIYLTGPDGQRIELVTEVGGSGDHFEKTIFDDQVEMPIVKARPPFTGRFRPEAALKREPSLSHFTGKNAKGVWQLVVRATRSDRFGMLHDWSLMFKTEEDLRSNLNIEASVPPQEDVSFKPYAAPGAGDDSAKASLAKAWPEKASGVEYARMMPEEDAEKWRKLTEMKLNAMKQNPGSLKQDLGEGGKKKQLSPEDLERYKQWIEAKRAGKAQQSEGRQLDKSSKKFKSDNPK